MATTTTTKRPIVAINAQKSNPATPMKPQQSGCAHLQAWLSSETDAFNRLNLATGWACGLSAGAVIKRSSPTTLPPACSTCSSLPMRPFLCLSCAGTFCGGLLGADHGAVHAQKERHQLAWDLRSNALYCFGCQDYVRHPGLERLAKAEKLQRQEDAIDRTEARPGKRRRVGMQKWELSAAETTSTVSARGIRNLGNSCYLSVILQTFFSNPYLRSYYLSDRHNRLACDKARQGEPCLSCEVDLLFSEQYSNETAPLAPTRFLHSFWQCSLEAAGYAQQDGHEFLISTLNLLHSTSPSHTDNPALKCPCIIHRTFSGQLRSAITCGRCGHQSETLEPFLDLSLDIRDRASGRMAETVKDALTSFTSSEQLPAKYDCDACGPGVPSAQKRLSLKTLPNVLCIQFKRFEHMSQASKIDTPVRYPLKLDMSPFLSQNLDYPAAAKTNPANTTSTYHLTAVVAHDGTLSQGHYTSYIRGADDYFAIDDDKVRRVRISEVLAAKAYLVVYSRI
ncbi:hypothetical protein JCM11641_006327 [Rhodosporidiobolus odoratus]